MYGHRADIDSFRLGRQVILIERSNSVGIALNVFRGDCNVMILVLK